MRKGLANLNDILSQVSVNGESPLNTDIIVERWKGLHKMYDEYGIKVGHRSF